jgi:hypothetical protein
MINFTSYLFPGILLSILDNVPLPMLFVYTL